MGEKGKRHRRFYLGVYRIGINLFIVHVFFWHAQGLIPRKINIDKTSLKALDL